MFSLLLTFYHGIHHHEKMSFGNLIYLSLVYVSQAIGINTSEFSWIRCDECPRFFLGIGEICNKHPPAFVPSLLTSKYAWIRLGFDVSYFFVWKHGVFFKPLVFCDVSSGRETFAWQKNGVYLESKLQFPPTWNPLTSAKDMVLSLCVPKICTTFTLGFNQKLFLHNPKVSQLHTCTGHDGPVLGDHPS